MKTVRMPKALGADAIEGVIGDERAGRPVNAHDLSGLGVGPPMGFEDAGPSCTEITWSKGDADVRHRGLQHVPIAVGEDGEGIARGAQPLQRSRHFGKGA